MPVKTASIQDHQELVRIARTSRYTQSFSNQIYSGPQMYERGWIGKFEERGKIKGLICLRHAVRKKKTVVYDVVVAPEYKGRGIGRALICWAMQTSPFGAISLNVDNENKEALKFYRSLGFKRVGQGEWKSGHKYTTFEINREKLVCKKKH